MSAVTLMMHDIILPTIKADPCVNTFIEKLRFSLIKQTFLSIMFIIMITKINLYVIFIHTLRGIVYRIDQLVNWNFDSLIREKCTFDNDIDIRFIIISFK